MTSACGNGLSNGETLTVGVKNVRSMSTFVMSSID